MNRHKYNVYMCVCPYCGLRLFSFTDHDVWENCESDDIETMYKSAFAYHRYMVEHNLCERCGRRLDWGNCQKMNYKKNYAYENRRKNNDKCREI